MVGWNSHVFVHACLCLLVNMLVSCLIGFITGHKSMGLLFNGIVKIGSP